MHVDDLNHPLERRVVLSLLGAQYSISLVLLLLWSWWGEHGLGEVLWFDGSALALGLAVGCALPVVTWCAMPLFPSFEAAVRWLQRLILNDLERRDTYVIALSSGVVEELVFRWALQSSFGVVPANLCFALLHYTGRARLAYTLWTLLVGFALSGLLWLAGGNVLAPIAAHVLNNFIALRLSLYERDRRRSTGG